MSDLGAIFHVKKDGTQYDAHAYTTLDECPYPNLKIKTKSGTQGYVKLTTNGQGDVPFRVKPKGSSTTYQVMAEAVPTGSILVKHSSLPYKFTVPANVKRIYAYLEESDMPYSNGAYISVTPGNTYTLRYTYSSGEIFNTYVYYINNTRIGGIHDSKSSIYIKWSPTINNA